MPKYVKIRLYLFYTLFIEVRVILEQMPIKED